MRERMNSGFIKRVDGWMAATVLLCALPAVAQDLRMQCGSAQRTHVETVSASQFSYNISMGGVVDGEMTRDPMGYWAYDQFWEPNVGIRLENIGDTAVVNPWIMRAGSVDTRSLRSIVDSIVKPGMSDAEKARRLWEYEIRTRFHATTQDDEVADAVKRINVYGYTLCYDESKVLSDLWRAAGLKVRQGFPNGHSLAEVFYDGDWHLLDSDESIISLLRDNETIASEAQVVADHDLMKRTHTYGVLADDDRMNDESSAALLYYEGERSGEQPSHTHHTMDFTLRPGESIAWLWNPANRFHARPFSFGGDDGDNWNQRWRVLAHAMDGEMTYLPDLGKSSTLEFIHVQGVEQRTSGLLGAGLYLTAQQGIVDVPVHSAYAIVGGRLEVDFARRSLGAGSVDIGISFDEGKSWKAVWSSAPSDVARMYVDLDPLFKRTDPARYNYTLRFTLHGDIAAAPVALNGFYLRSTLQMARLAMPGVVLGDNGFFYSDQTQGEHRVRITHTWDECDAAISLPGIPVALEPADGKTFDGTRVKFVWSAGPGAQPADYEFELSEFADMRWALSSNFHKLISHTADRGTASYTLTSDGLLNPGQKYFWHVRARAANHTWGPWSRTVAFMSVAPAVPLDVKASFDSASRTVHLAWRKGEAGTAPSRYRIYGSSERAFTANDKPYDYNAGLDGTGKAPGNLLLETIASSSSIVIPEALWRPYYRVVAVDNHDRISGPSAMAELMHPLLAASGSLPVAHKNSFYKAQVATSASIGHLVSAEEDGKPYQLRFRTSDELEYSLEGAPSGLTIDSMGIIAGFVEAASKNSYRVTVRVKDKRRGYTDAITLTLPVTATL